MIDCTLVTCESVPALDPDDRVLLHELRRRGLRVSIAVWSDPGVDWSATRLCVLRSTWDYDGRYPAFDDWIERVARVTTVRNDPALLRWNAHKSYLRDLERAGVPVVPTAWVCEGEPTDLAALTDARSWQDVVIKPARGAAARNVLLVGRQPAARAAGEAHLARLAAIDDVLVQPYLETVASYQERVLMFLGGAYSHAAVKNPFDTKLTVSDSPSTRVTATAEEIGVAQAALAAVPGITLYARVDLLRDSNGRPVVSELELIEPSLYLAVHQPARTQLADAIERELEVLAN